MAIDSAVTGDGIGNAAQSPVSRPESRDARDFVGIREPQPTEAHARCIQRTPAALSQFEPHLILRKYGHCDLQVPCAGTRTSANSIGGCK